MTLVISDKAKISPLADIEDSVRGSRIVIGDDAVIGPNAVVMTHVPAGAIVAAPQSRIVAPPPRREAPRK